MYMNAPEDYKFIGEVLQSAVGDRAVAMEQDYLDSVRIGEGQTHELHSDALQASQEAAIATRRDDIANTDQAIDWLTRQLHDPLLSSSERETLEGRLKTLQSSRKGHQAAQQEVVDQFRGQLSQAAHEKAEAELGQFDSYEFWGGDSDESTQAVASGYPAPAPETRVGFVQPTPQQQRAGIPRQLRPGFPAFPPPVPEQRVGFVPPAIEPAPAPIDNPPQPVVTPPILKQGFPPAPRPLVPERQAGFNFPIAPAPEAAPVLPPPPVIPPAPERAPAPRALTDIAVPPKPETEDTKEAKAFQIDVGFAHEAKPGHDEDRSIVNESEGLFAVFDGNSHVPGAALAAVLAQNVIEKYFVGKPITKTSHSPEENLARVKSAMAWAHQVIIKAGDAGVTTAVVAKLFTDEAGNLGAAWGAIGDSRIYKINRREGTIEQITQDEGFRGYPTNTLGSMGHEIVQGGTVTLATGDYLVLCSDGITGSDPENSIDDSKVRNAVVGGLNSEVAAKTLLENSKKLGDATAIVVRNTAAR